MNDESLRFHLKDVVRLKNVRFLLEMSTFYLTYEASGGLIKRKDVLRHA
jgi:hypothetical protein